MTSLALTARQRGADHGYFLYLYTNIRTNQVVYSLTRALDNTKVLRQLTYYGKQTKPRALRKDMWRPFVTVKFPTPEYGLSVMKQLREYRLLRDHSWTWKPTKAEIEAAKQKLAEGEPVNFDLTLPTMKERAKLLMDQRAYSVADLADILSKEVGRFSRLKQEKKAERKAQEKAKRGEWEVIEKLAADADNGGIDAVNAHIKNLEARIEKSRSDKIKARSHGGIKVLKMKRNSFVRAQEALSFIAGGGIPLERRQRWNQALQAMVQERTDRQVIPLTPEQEKAAERKKAMEAQNSAVAKAIEVVESITPTPKRGKHAKLTPMAEKALRRTPALKASAILVQWSNIRDAEYAAEWPREVFHEWMGTAVHGRKFRHTAPQAGLQPENELRMLPVELTEEEEKQMEEGVDLDGESNEGKEDGEGETEEDGDGEEEKKSKGFLGKIRENLPFIGSGGKKEGGMFSKGP